MISNGSVKMENKYLSVDESVKFINEKYQKRVTQSNISYLIKYGQLHRYIINGSTYVYQKDIEDYFSRLQSSEKRWKSNIGGELNWELSFDNVKEYERTKHVHRLHPYKGKFIPQLVEYFLDQHLNGSKKEIFFNPGDIVIDPFCGSGTTLVQANELGINAIGIDISEFNTLMSNIKVEHHDLVLLSQEVIKITQKLRTTFADSIWNKFDSDLANAITEFNKEYFPTPDILYRIRSGEINISSYSIERVKEINEISRNIQQKYDVNVHEANSNGSFINKWFTPPVKNEIIFMLSEINKVKNEDTKNILKLILSRTARSCRATTHSDLATLIDPIFDPYYCHKHNKICKPLFSLSYWWDFYSKDTIKRLSEFDQIRTNTHQVCVTGDSRNLDFESALSKLDPDLLQLLRTKKAKGIFTSPPYVGMIDYHEQHAYAYELFNIPRRDSEEIGPQSKGKGSAARNEYIDGISSVLTNMLNYMVDDCEVFIVANDSYDLYPQIARNCNLIIFEEYLRPVLNRTEKDKSAYSEKIFRMKRL